MKIQGFGNATEEMIAQYERYIGFLLPEDYKQFLRKYNGGVVRNEVFWVDDLQQIIPLDLMLGLVVDTELNLIKWYDDYKKDLLQKCIIIGFDPGSGIIVLISDPEIGGVYYWDHSFYFDKSNKEENTYWIADSFTEFINCLKEDNY